jgi:hypothetical protein
MGQYRALSLSQIDRAEFQAGTVCKARP